MIVERIKQFLDFKGISIAAFEKSVGMSNSSFGKCLKNGGAIGTDKLENILRVYPELSPEWLLTGEGEMIKDPNTKNAAVNEGVIKMYEDLLASRDKRIRELEGKLIEGASKIG